MSKKPSFFYTPLLLLFILICTGGCEQPDQKITAREGLAEINGTELYFKRIGEGEPVVVLHGGPVLEHGYLVPYLEPLADRYELIFFDQRLSGRSSADLDSTEVRLSEFVEDIEGLRRRMDLDKIHLLGHSWGGFLAMNYALKYPSSLRSLVLLNSMPASSELWRKEEKILARGITRENRLQRQAIISSSRFQRDNSEAVEQLLKLFYRNQFRDPSLADSLDFDLPDNYAERGKRFGYVMQDIENYDLHPDLASVETPALLLYGSIEPSAAASGPKIRESMPNSELVIIEDTGHFPFIEKPDIFLTELRAFLKEH